jgi:cell division protein FtsL
MSNLARQVVPQVAPEKKQSVHIHKEQRRAYITPGEKVLSLVFVVFICFMAVKIITVQASIYDVNKDIQTTQQSLKEQDKANKDLKMQISELSRYERIWEKAKGLGLKLNDKNVKVVEEQ